MQAKKINWEKGSLPGIRFYKHATRKHGVKLDKYFSGSYQVRGKRKFGGFGWNSEGWTEKKVWEKINEYKHNLKIGNGPTTLKEEIALKEVEIEEKKQVEQEKAKQDITFSEYFENTYISISKTSKKPESWRKELEHFENWLKPELGHIPIKKIIAFNLEKVKKNMQDAGRAPRSIQYVFATFRQVWNYARLNDIVNNDSPTRKIKLTQVKNNRLRFFTHKEADILLSTLKNKSEQTHDMTLFSLHTGARAGEIFSLTWGVVDLKNGTAQLRDSKGADRHAYLTDATQNMLEHRFNDQSASEFIFKDSNGKQINKISNTFFRTINELGFNDGVTDRRDKALFHTCRHTFASWHVQNGTDLYTVKDLLGHSTIQLTERYSHLRPDGLKMAARNFDNQLKENNIISLEKTENA